MRRLLLLGPLLLLFGCGSVLITPATVGEAEAVPRDERDELISRWSRAVELANGFLASDYCVTLPRGRIVLRDWDGMTFVTADRSYPINVRWTWWGDRVVDVNAWAQEREDGFVVGRRREEARDLAVDNSFFYATESSRLTVAEMTTLILHETAHIVFREGTIGVWNSLLYYLEVLFTWRSHNEHSAEERPRQVDREFRGYTEDPPFPKQGFAQD